MANRLKIVYTANPAAWDAVHVKVEETALGYSTIINKIFVSVPPANPLFMISRGTTMADSVANLLANLNAYNNDGNMSFEAGASGEIYINFKIPGTYTASEIYDGFTVVSETVTALEPVTLPELSVKDLSISIFDTYTNERILIEELAQASACKIDWDGGDDLYQSIMASKLVFNMLVANFEDAHFLHLFSGDENRFRVELTAIDALENEQLIWQGFLLPDQYREQYKTAPLFVDFTATDMLGALKGKYFEPWYYNNKLPLSEVLALALANTGIAQPILVKPSLVPDSALFPWETINVNLEAFIDGDKYKDCYQMVESLCKAHGLVIYAYRGYWFLEGITRRDELTTTMLQFDINGKRTNDVIVNKTANQCMFSADAPLLTALTPWKKINVGYKISGTKNLYSDNIVSVPKDEIYSTTYSTGNYVGEPAPPNGKGSYGTGMVKAWTPNFNADFVYRYDDYIEVRWNVYRDLLMGIDAVPYNYNYTEAMALINYIECPERPYVKEGVLYEMEMEFYIENLVIPIDTGEEVKIEKAAKDGKYDSLIPFQILVGGVEKYSNLPSKGNNTIFKYIVTTEVTDKSGNDASSFTYKMKAQFRFDVEGEMVLRILMPIFNNDDTNWPSIGPSTPVEKRTGLIGIFQAKKLKVTAIEGYDENGDIIADRPINFTQEFAYDIDISCTADNSVVNSFGLGLPVDDDYFKTIDRTVDAYEVLNYNYFAPATLLELDLQTFKSPKNDIPLLFAENVRKSTFLEKVSGEKIEFSSLWFQWATNKYRLAYLESFEGFPNIPKDYVAYPDVAAGDVLKYMHVKYAAENYANRLNWKVYGTEEILSFPKALAKALHGVQPEMIYRLEGTALDLVFPDQLIDFRFDNADRIFIPTRLSLDLFGGKTEVTGTEAKFTNLNDISYANG